MPQSKLVPVATPLPEDERPMTTLHAVIDARGETSHRPSTSVRAARRFRVVTGPARSASNPGATDSFWPPFEVRNQFLTFMIIFMWI